MQCIHHNVECEAREFHLMKHVVKLYTCPICNTKMETWRKMDDSLNMEEVINIE